MDLYNNNVVHPKGDQSGAYIGRTDAEAETPILWPPHAKSWLIGKDLDAGRDWGQEEKGTTEEEMAGWHHQLNAHEFGWTLGVGDGQGGLACWDSWEAWRAAIHGRPGVLRFTGSQRVGHDWATELNWTEWSFMYNVYTRGLLSLEGRPVLIIQYLIHLPFHEIPESSLLPQ